MKSSNGYDITLVNYYLEKFEVVTEYTVTHQMRTCKLLTSLCNLPSLQSYAKKTTIFERIFLKNIKYKNLIIYKKVIKSLFFYILYGYMTHPFGRNILE